ncbi:MAG: hypothetical protein IT379_41115 [Deltaproteobacteria bacterium]|nr:hypothetical protein [Deltaproteobacteria bacterium]
MTSAPRRRARWPAVLVLVAVAELVAQLDVIASVPGRDDWSRAAQWIRTASAAEDREVRSPVDASPLSPRREERALVVVEPAWAAPLGRLALRRVELGDTAPADLAGRRALWALSIRGHAPAAMGGRRPTEMRRFGRVSVLRYAIDEPRESFDLVREIERAQVAWGGGSMGWGACALRHEPVRGGGLAAGTMLPADRFVCDRSRPWLAVGATFQQDVGLAVRRCVGQTAARGIHLRARFPEVPARGVLEGRFGLAHGDERLRGADVWLEVRVAGRLRARVRHRDGEGAKAFAVELGGDAARTFPSRGAPLGEGAASNVDVAIDTALARGEGRALDGAWRMPCWSASVRSRRGATRIETR